MTYPFHHHPYYVQSTSRDRKMNTGKRERTTYNKEQLDYLESEFRIGEYPEAPRKEEIAVKMGLEEGKIAIWFKNRRAKDRSIKRQMDKMDKLCGSTGSTPSESSVSKSSPSSKQDCSPDSTTASPWIKKEKTTVSSPPAATVPSSIASMPTVFPFGSWTSPDSSMSNGLTALPSSSPPAGTTVPSFPPQFVFNQWMMPGADPTALPPAQSVNSEEAGANAATPYPMQYPAYPYYNMFYFDPNGPFPPYSG